MATLPIIHEAMTEEQKWLRYAMCVDTECMIDDGMQYEQIKDWFKSDEAAEAYELTNSKTKSGEILSEVFINEISARYFK